MTRVNIGIESDELSDEHLRAEYRELPRCFRKFKGKPPAHFKLNEGHMRWCAQHPRMLADRFECLVAELEFRGFHPQYRHAPDWAQASTLVPPACEIVRARPILIERIQSRLVTSKVPHRWTRREPPDWAIASGAVLYPRAESAVAA